MGYLKKLVTLVLLVGLTMSGCDNKNSQPDLFQYKGSYVGNNNAISHILNNLPITAYPNDFELQTKQQPYGLILNYIGSEPQQQREKIIIYTATYLFALIQNIDWIRYNFADQQYTISKEQMRSWYGVDLHQIQTADELDVLINQHINDEHTVKQLMQ